MVANGLVSLDYREVLVNKDVLKEANGEPRRSKDTA